MGELGERLRTAREAKDLTIDQVAEQSRIQRAYLEALESESFAAFSSELHARGFLRNYAAYLGLKPEEVLALYDNARGKIGTKRVPSAHLAAPARPTRSRASEIIADVLLLFIGVVFLGIVGVYLYRRQAVEQIQPTEGPTAAPTAVPLPTYDGTAYKLDVNLYYADHKLDVKQEINYTNVTSTTLSDLMLNVHPNRSKGTFVLNSVKLDMGGQIVQPEVYPLDVTLKVILPKDLPPDEQVTLYLSYTLSLPRIKPEAEFSDASFGYSERAISLGNWYPVMAPYRQDKGWYSLSYFPVGDPYVTEVADYQVTITTTQGVILAGTGVETHTGNQWRYTAERVRSFALAASEVYLIESAPVGNQTVYSYYFPGDEAAGRAALDTAAQALELFTELFGPYPLPAFRLCETDFAGGLEFGGLAFLGSSLYDQYDGTTQASLIPLTAHEVAHQWFYGLVGNDQVSEPWLDEALAQYSSYLYYEHYLPSDKQWWWDTEVRQYAPAGKIDMLIYQFRNNRDYINAVYRRGAEFIRDLRETMGDPAFSAFMKEYVRRYAYQIAKARDFFALVREFTTADLMPLQETYFRQRTMP